MNISATIRKIRKLEIKTRHLVNTLLAGDYHTVFKGQGVSFSDLREYQAGDDIRFIDWQITAKTGKPYVKLFSEERELTVFLVVDVSASGQFGSVSELKIDAMAQVAALIGFSALKNQDKVGLLLVSDKVELMIPPKKGKAHVFKILSHIFAIKPVARPTQLSVGFDMMKKVLKKRGIVFVLSDFYDNAYQKSLQLLSRRQDVVPLVFRDQRDTFIPKSGLIRLHDLEDGTSLLLNFSNPAVRSAFATQRKAFDEQLVHSFKTVKKKPVFLHLQEDYIAALQRYFSLQKKRMR